MKHLAQRVFLGLFLLLCAPIASAQMMMATGGGGDQTQAIELPDPLTPEAVRELVSTLSDEDVRNLLLARLDALSAEAGPAEASGSAFEFLQRAASGAFDSVWVATIRVPNLYSSQAESFTTFHQRLGWEGIGVLLGSILIAVAVGFVAEKITNVVTRRWHSVALQNDDPQTLLESVRFLFFRLCTDIYGLIAFFIVARTVGILVIPEDMLQFAQIIFWYMIVLPRLGIAFTRFVLAPYQPKHRLVHTDDKTARFLNRHQFGIILLMGFAIAIVNFNQLNGVAMGESRLGFWLNLGVHLYLIYVAWKAWDGLVMMMRGSDPDVTPWEEKFARIYPGYVIGVSIVTWLLVNVLVGFQQFELLQGAPHYKMMFVLSIVPALDTMVRGLVRHLTPPMSGEGMIAERAYQSTKRSYIRIGRVVVFGLVVLIVANFWGLDPRTIASAGVGAQFAGNLIEIMIVIAMGYLTWEVVSLYINRKLAAEQTALGFDLSEDEPGGGEGGGAGGSRLSTVLPLVLGMAKATIATVFGLVALGNIGIDVTPLLAGAGIVGLAVGFGAQKLVADIVSGIFFLVDDAFRTGEYVEVEGTVGTVENISIRSMQLRHHKGPVHTIPYGEIPKITNFSRDWVIMKLKFTVPFDTDPNKVKKIFKKIGQDMINDEAWQDDFLQPFKSQGVFDFDDVGMIIRGKFMAKPGKQFMARKEIYNRVKAAFEEAGIDFARREVRVAIPGLEGSDKLSDTEKTAVAAAASSVAQEQVAEQGPVKDKPGS